MTNIIISGFKSNKLISQGYHTGTTVLGGDSASYYYGNERKQKKDDSLLYLLKTFLENITA
jgi:hypothetical protein